MTTDPLKEIHNILDDFEEKIAHTQTFWEELRELNPSFEQVNEEHWHEKHSKMWLHGGTTPDECHELERWLTDYLKWLAKTGHKIGKNKLSFAPINKKIEGKKWRTKNAAQNSRLRWP